MRAPRSRPVKSLYVHVPFCARKCSYCAFYSEASDGAAKHRYLEALLRDMTRVAGDVRPVTIFFGGGTPSLLTLGQWERLFQHMRSLGWTDAEEWTVECNPATVSLDKAKLWRDGGVNRISMGVQSLHEGLLERLGRVHTRAMVFRSFDVLRRAGFGNINIDLMFAIPGQTMEMWRATLDEALAMHTEHLSSYEVIYEEDTPLYAQLRAGAFPIDENLACDMYEALLDAAASRGFFRYEIANLAKDDGKADRWGTGTLGCQVGLEPEREAEALVPSRACLHNMNYWRGGPFLGLGPSAASYVDGLRWKQVADTTAYCDFLEEGRSPVVEEDWLSPLARAGEVAGFGLRMAAGWSFDEFQNCTGVDLRSQWSGVMEDLVARHWAVQTWARFRLTEAGLRFADAVAEMFLVEEEKEDLGARISRGKLAIGQSRSIERAGAAAPHGDHGLDRTRLREGNSIGAQS